MAAPLLESVPNFSFGPGSPLGGELRGVVEGAGPLWLDGSSDPDHNRAVITLAGTPETVLAGLFEAVALAVERLDLRSHRGVHPRVGVADVVPLVPLAGCDLVTCFAWAHALGERIWAELSVPVYFYGRGVRLADIRAGRVRPALGGPALHPSAGAVCVGARRFLIAYNVLLPGASEERARTLARTLREAGGGLRGVQALAFPVEGGWQLSCNLTRPEETAIPELLAAVRRLEPEAGPPEVVGLCPAFAAGPGAEGKILEARIEEEAGRRLEAGAGGEQERALLEYARARLGTPG